MMLHHGLHGDVISNCSHWSDIETKCLIKIWREPTILAEVRDVTSKHKTVYKRIAKRIAAQGHHRDESQIKNKIRTLTTNYRKLLKMKDRANWAGQGKQTFLYFNELHEFVDVGLGNTSAAELGEGAAGGQEGASPSSPSTSISSTSIPQPQQGTIKGEDSHHRVPTTVAFDRANVSNDFGDPDETVKNSGCVDGASLLNTNGRPGDHQIHHLSSDEEFDEEGSQEMQNHPMIDAGWISDDDEVECEEPRTKLKCKADLRLHPSIPKKENTRNRKKDESMKHMVKMLMENNMHRDKVLMEAEDAHRRREAERHTEEIRLLRDQIQLERDRLQFEREERERIELIRREEAARNERLRREEMERTEKARLDERDREERRFTLMMALIKGAQNHSN